MMGPFEILLLVLVLAVGGFVLVRRASRGGTRTGAAVDRGVGRLIRIADSNDRARANEAIRELGRTQSDEALEYLLRRAGGATYSVDARTAAALEALGTMSHPLGVDRLLQVVASGSVAVEHALRGLDLVRGDAAVSALLKAAQTSDDYHCVKAAVRTLERLGTPASTAALDQFRRHPARSVTRRELETGRIPESTTIFGQRG